MKALLLTSPGHFDHVDVPDPVPGPGDVLIRVRACGICGSDIHGMDGSSGRRIPPIVMGHEAGGEIAEVGREVAAWHPGDRVTFDSTIYCGACRYCATGMTNLCDDRRVLGVSCADYRCDGAFAEYIVVPARVLFRLPPEVSFVDAAIVEPLSVAAHAVSLARVGAQTTSVIVGTGVIGLLLVQSLRAAGCQRIIAVDVNAERLSRALRLGATTSIRSNAVDVQEELWHATDGRGADVAFEAVGISPTVNLAIEGVRKGGTVVLVGNLAPEVAFPLQSVVTRQISLHGSTASAGEYATCIDWLARRRVDPGELISAVAPLADGQGWFDRLRGSQGDLLKVILEP